MVRKHCNPRLVGGSTEASLWIEFLFRWDQMWLNEGFAEYVSNIASHYIDPEIHTWERFYVEETQWVMYEDQDTRHHWAMTDTVTTRSSLIVRL